LGDGGAIPLLLDIDLLPLPLDGK
jgi:hypothetical protein